MVNSSLSGPILVWTLALWALGWLVLPRARRVFVGLPDGGLAAGRLLFIVLVALFSFWGATLHLLPLKLAPAVAALTALMCAAGWRNPEARDWARQNWRGLAFSDAIFLACWAAFLWIRLSHPEINDLEKPMDVALLSAAWKTDWLPFAHPWWGGAQFTNYYYFGPMMGALMGRALNTAPQFAYNLVQPAFCAFFLSISWALGSSLTRSKRWGVVVMLLVGWSGPLEPLRQWSEKGWSWPFDWWTTSRVIPNTINEYPAFTMAIGDAHAHFYALSFAMLWLCLAWSLFAPAEIAPEAVAPLSKSQVKKRARMEEKVEEKIVAQFPHRRRTIIFVGGLVLGAWLMTNTWDAPIFGLLFSVAIWRTSNSKNGSRSFLAAGAPFVIAIATAALYFWRFHSPVRGAQLDVWAPERLSFALLWGGWIVLGALALLLPHSSHGDGVEDGELDSSARFRRLLIGAGLIALVAPFLFYIRGAFGDGDLRHQDTVFKFGLQAWLLLGVGISAELGARFLALKTVPRFLAAFVSILLAPVLVLASGSTIWTRAVSQGTSTNLGQSLDGMRYLPLADQQAITWLQRNGRAGEIVMEGVQFKDGAMGGDYDANWGRVGAFSGLSSTLGWPQHVWGWDGNYEQVVERANRINALYALSSPFETARGATELGARYTFFGSMEAGGNWQVRSGETASVAGFATYEFTGADGSRALILERIGR